MTTTRTHRTWADVAFAALQNRLVIAALCIALGGGGVLGGSAFLGDEDVAAVPACPCTTAVVEHQTRMVRDDIKDLERFLRETLAWDGIDE